MSSHPSSSNRTSGSDQNYEFMSKFSLTLIHKILLTDPVDFPNLTMNGLPKAKQMSFSQFVIHRGFPVVLEQQERQQQQRQAMQMQMQTGESYVGGSCGSNSSSNSTGCTNANGCNNANAIQQSLCNLSISTSAAAAAASNQLSMEEQIAQTMHRAYNDMILNQMMNTTAVSATTSSEDKQQQQQQRTFAPLKSILLEIHALLRSTIPHRKDLHSILKDEELMNNNSSNNSYTMTTAFKDDSFISVCKYLKKVADVLCMLESEYRAETTKQWRDEILDSQVLRLFFDDDDDDDDDDDGIEDSVCNDLLEIKRSDNDDDDDDNNSSSSSSSNDVQEENKNEEDTFTTSSYNTSFSISREAFALASTTYLHYKAELCQSETADFQLAHILAPRIYTQGSKFLYHAFMQKFLNDNTGGVYQGGTNSSSGTVSDGGVDVVNMDADVLKDKLPNTKVWIHEMIQNTTLTTSFTREELISSQEKRIQVLSQTGWIDNILFRSPRSVNEEEDTGTTSGQPTSTTTYPPSLPTAAPPSSSQFIMPEVFWLDMTSVRDIRITTKLAVVGSVLALHAITAARVSDSILKQDPLDSNIDECRVRLANAMSNRSGINGMTTISSQEDYENRICQVVVDLAKAMNTTAMSNNDIEQALVNRAKATLRGEDPVIKLLDNRMRGVFRELMIQKKPRLDHQQQQTIPITMKSGRVTTAASSSGTRSSNNSNDLLSCDVMYKKFAREEFVKKGFAFYSTELAEASLLAYKTISLVLRIHGNSILDKMFISSI